MANWIESAYMTEAERFRLLSLLERSGSNLLRHFQLVSDRVWRFRPAGRWSPGDIAEHLLKSERGLRSAAEGALAKEPSPDWDEQTRGKDIRIEVTLTNRQHKAGASPSLVPEGRLSRDEILTGFERERSATITLARNVTAPVKAHLLKHGDPFFGWLNAYQWLLYAGFHSVRHLEEAIELSNGVPLVGGSHSAGERNSD